ncbi:Lrp/AsnC family transcriptional regulator [Candidatus Micrarchaeota archaeon]|nr:Lrp/AsnC family transcriptional regulator [Candidatus Micrarchaeota archaeon]
MDFPHLDQKDQDILHALQKDSRKTVAELSNELGIPRATVHERIVKLRKTGVIKRFTIEQDYGRTGKPTMAFVFASYDRNAHIDQHQLAKKVSQVGGVLGVYVVSGEWDLLIKVRGKSIEHIGTLIVDEIRRLPGIFKTHSIACFEAVKDDI